MARGNGKRVEEIFQVVVDLPPDQRTHYLDSTCGSETALRSEVEKLLRVHDQGVVDAFRTPLLFANDAPSVADEPLTKIGRYTILRKIGEGGLGVVYEARQDNPNRLVALKVMRPGLLSEQLVRRFKREADVLGQLQHPGIAQIHDAGTAPDTLQPYLAMELVRGQQLHEYAAAARLGTRDKLDLVAKIGDAVQHAHDRGVIHRDLKPTNILVDETGQPKVLDFGVARVTDSDLITATLKTDVGQLIGTVPYMSPEQVSGDVAQLDTRSDVYALGVVLYELLSGRLPVDVRGRSIPEAVRLIQEQDPTRLSSIDSSFRGEIDTLVAKAIEKDKYRRYPSAAELSADIRRFLRDEPIVARPTSTFYHFRKFAKRNKALVGGVCTAMLLLTIVALQQTLARREAQRMAYRSGLSAAAAALRGFNCYEARRQLEQVSQGLRGWEWHHLYSQLDDSMAKFQPGEAYPIAFGPDKNNNVVYVLTKKGDPRPFTLPLYQYGVLGLALSENRMMDGRTFEAQTVLNLNPRPERICYVGPDSVVYAEGVLTGSDRIALGRVRYESRTNTFLPSPINPTQNGRSLIWIDEEKIYASDLYTGERRNLAGHIPGIRRALAFNADGSLIAFPAGDPTSPEIHVLNSQDGQLQHQWRGHKNSIWRMEFSPDGSRLLSVSLDHTIRQWLLDETQEPAWTVITDHTDRVLSVAHSPDGDRFASVGRDRTVRLWDAQSGEAMGVFLGHEEEIHDVIFSADGSRLATASTDGTTRVWEVPRQGHPRVLRRHTSFVYALALSPDSSRIASGGWDGTIRLWDADSGEEVVTWVADPTGEFSIVEGLAFDAQGEHIAVCDRTWHWPPRFRVRILDVATGVEISNYQDTGMPGRIAFHPNGSVIAGTGGLDPRLFVLEGKTLQKVADAPGQSFCSFSPDGTRLITSDGSNILMYQTATLKRVATLAGHKGSIPFACYSPDGRRIASVGWDHTVRVWDGVSGKPLAELRGHTDRVYTVAFSPDGSRIVSGSNDRTIRVWDARTLEDIVSLVGHKDYVYSLAFSRDGRRLVSASGDFTVRIWETDPLVNRIQAQRDRRAKFDRSGS